MEPIENIKTADQNKNRAKRSAYETPAIIYEGKIGIRAGTPIGPLAPGGPPGGLPGVTSDN